MSPPWLVLGIVAGVFLLCPSSFTVVKLVDSGLLLIQYYTIPGDAIMCILY